MPAEGFLIPCFAPVFEELLEKSGRKLIFEEINLLLKRNEGFKSKTRWVPAAVSGWCLGLLQSGWASCAAACTADMAWQPSEGGVPSADRPADSLLCCSASDSRVQARAAVWRMPKELESGSQESPDDSASTTQTLELLCHLDNTAHGSVAW